MRAGNFIGRTFKLSFMADPSKMSPGNNYARIKITSVRQTIEIEITAIKPGIKHEVVLNSLLHKGNIIILLNCILVFLWTG